MAFDGLSAQYLRDRAEEVREAAKTCRDPLVKEELDGIADRYEELVNQLVRNRVRWRGSLLLTLGSARRPWEKRLLPFGKSSPTLGSDRGTWVWVPSRARRGVSWPPRG